MPISTATNPGDSFGPIRIGPKTFDLTGHKFGRITFVRVFSRYQRPGGYVQTYTWEAVCDCGTRLVIFGNKVTKRES